MNYQRSDKLFVVVVKKWQFNLADLMYLERTKITSIWDQHKKMVKVNGDCVQHMAIASNVWRLCPMYGDCVWVLWCYQICFENLKIARKTYELCLHVASHSFVLSLFILCHLPPHQNLIIPHITIIFSV